EIILPILGTYAPDLSLSIEDEPPVRELPIFEPKFLTWHPDLTPVELAELVRVAHQCQTRIDRGDIPEPYHYEAVGWLAEGETRITESCTYLREVLGKVGLR
ncbi:MAG TPA: hypothetical protein VMW65_14325, partial [Chloroflexota bacterium]|nr:hypothetical protein [Chloroflexota bacterium]